MSQFANRRLFSTTPLRIFSKPHFRPVDAVDIRPGDTLLSNRKSGFALFTVDQAAIAHFSNEVVMTGVFHTGLLHHATVPLHSRLWRLVR